MAAIVRMVPPEDAEVLRKYITPGDSNQGVALVFDEASQRALKEADIEDGEVVDYDFGGNPDAYFEAINVPSHYLIRHLTESENE